MSTIQKTLETLFAKVCFFLEPRQKAAAEALSDIAEEPYHLSEDELTVLRPALERARRGKFSADATTNEILTKSWGRKSRMISKTNTTFNPSENICLNT